MVSCSFLVVERKTSGNRSLTLLLAVYLGNLASIPVLAIIGRVGLELGRNSVQKQADRQWYSPAKAISDATDKAQYHPNPRCQRLSER